MKIDVLTAFPEMFEGPLSESIIQRAREEESVEIEIHDLRDWSEDKHRSIDSPPYGGGPGMVLRVDIIDKAVEELKGKESRVILLSAKGQIYKQEKAVKLASSKHMILIAGHYEGVDQRVFDHVVDDVISIGEYVLTGGEIPAMAVIDSVVRLIPGVVGNEESVKDESFSEPGVREYPQYTRPDKYKGWVVPEILKSGHHEKIERWREEKKRIV